MPSRPLSILFVDDSFETRDLFRLSFSLGGHFCRTAPNGSKALEIIAQNPYNLDVIIVDYHMPDRNGLDVVQELRRMEGVPAIPVIMFTGEAPGILESQAKELDIARVLYKPIRPADLMGAVEVVANLRSSQHVESAR